MIKLLILGNGQPVELVITSLNKRQIEVINVEQDKTGTGEQQIEFENFLKSRGIMLNGLKNLKRDEYNFVLSVNYNKIIDTEEFSGINIVNLHIGLLPRYRGNNANAWAVMNGENKVGYSLHKVSEILDGGDIYYKYEYDISKDDNYSKAKEARENDIAKNLSNVLMKIYNNEIAPVSQEGSSFIYGTKLRKSDGIIDNWNVSSDFLIRKNYVFGKPAGTGLSFKFKNAYYEIDKISEVKNFLPSVGIPGCIVYINGNKLWVKTNDTAVEISGIQSLNSSVDVKATFKIGMRLQESSNKIYDRNNLKETSNSFKSCTQGSHNYEEEYLNLPFEDKLRKYRKKNLLKTIHSYPHKHILEIGCGPEPLFMDFTDFDRMVIVEPGTLFYHMAKTYARKNEKVVIINGLIENSIEQLKSETFDFIIAGGFLHEIDNADEVLESIRRICSKNTIIYSFVPNAESFHRLLALKMGLIENIFQKSEHDELFGRKRVFDQYSFSQLFIARDFKILDAGSYFVKPFSHKQMNEILKLDSFEPMILEGFDGMIDFLPKMGTELWNVCKKKS